MAQKHPDLILGTAGHIDHGKSSLVLALTGKDPDRLAEEKRRGITIELGFAQLILPDGRTMGVVDVPGHERFVRQMIAGSTGIDVALLVIAADDGVMPQTIEHVAVLETLGVDACVVALTKCDMVDDDWQAFMADEVRTWLASTRYAEAPLVPVSSVTGTGLDELRGALAAVCTTAHRTKTGTARMPIDRVFTIKGAGTVVTGTLWSGTVAEGDTLTALPSGLPCRVRSVQEHDIPVPDAHAGNRVALNLAGISVDDVRPGDFLCTPGTLEPTDRFDAHVTFVDSARRGKPLKTGARLHIAHGTKEVLGRILLCDGCEALKPGEQAFAQIRLEQPLPLARGDRFVMRMYSPVSVAGGGGVLLAHPRRRTTLSEGERALLDALTRSDFNSAVEETIALARLPLSIGEIAHSLDIPGGEARHAAAEACRKKHAVQLESGGETFYATSAALQKSVAAMEKELLAFHAENPTEAGLSKDALHARVAPRASENCFAALLSCALASGRIMSSAGLIGHATAQTAVQAARDDAAEALAPLLEKAGMAPPSVLELASQLGIDVTLARKALAQLVEQGRAKRITSDLFFSTAAYTAAKTAAETCLSREGSATMASLRDAVGTSRKYAVPLFEHFDAIGFTVRDGDLRRRGV